MPVQPSVPGRPRRYGRGAFLWTTTLLWTAATTPAAAQTPAAGEVRQLVTFTLLPGRYAEVIRLYTERAVPLYEANEHMASFRVFREAESPFPLDLMVVSGFQGMAGMDRSNRELRRLAAAAETSIGGLYGEISALSSGHTDEFVEMLPQLGSGDPTGSPLTAFIWVELLPGAEADYEALVRDELVPLEVSLGRSSATGRFLVSDGWHYLRAVGLGSLADYQSYRAALRDAGVQIQLSRLTDRRREALLVSVRELTIR